MIENTAILGGGISGLALGWKLSQNGVPIDIFESHSSIGGLAGTYRENGYNLDYGPHSLFSENQDIVDTVLELFPGDLTARPRKAQFLYKGSYLDYPLTAQGLFSQMGFVNGIKVALSYLHSKLSPSKSHCSPVNETVEDWAITHFGNYLYQTFFKPYTEQFWQMPCSELSSRSIPSHTKMGFKNTLRALLYCHINKKDFSIIDREKLPTYYPPNGFGEISDKISQKICQLGGVIHLNSQVTSLIIHDNSKYEVVYSKDTEEHSFHCRHVISTMPLPILIKNMRPKPPKEVLVSAEYIDYRPLLVLGMVTEKQDILDSDYVYMLDRPYNRMYETNKFSSKLSPPGENIFAVEIACLRSSEAWSQTKEELFDKCIPFLEKDEIITGSDVKKLILVKAPFAYPIYKKNYKYHLDNIMAYIKHHSDLYTLGRSGEYMYMDSDKCIERAFKLANKITKDIKN